MRCAQSHVDCVDSIVQMVSEPHIPELVVGSGIGKHGAVGSISRGLRPNVNLVLPFEACTGVWALRTSAKAEFDNVVVLGCASKTRILRSAVEDVRTVGWGRGMGVDALLLWGAQRFEEVAQTDCDFHMAGQTLAAGNVSGGEHMVQVFAGGIRVMRGFKLKCTHEMRTSDPIDVDGLDCGTTELRAAQVCDPFVVCHVGDERGSLRLLRTCADGTLEQVESCGAVSASADAVAAVWIHHDASGDLAAAVAGRVRDAERSVPAGEASAEPAVATSAASRAVPKVAPAAASTHAADADDEEAMLYAPSSPVKAVPPPAADTHDGESAVDPTGGAVEVPCVIAAIPLAPLPVLSGKHYLVVLRASGLLQVREERARAVHFCHAHFFGRADVRTAAR